MKLILGLIFAILMTAVAISIHAQGGPKLFVHIEYQEHNDRVIFIQDRETGTRCYAITNNIINSTGYAISCVKP